MKFAYKFSNLLGTVYNQGNILFAHDGERLLSPVGNRISAFDLKQNKSQTLPVESQKSFTCIALAPSGVVLLAVTEDGEALLISLISKTVLHRHRFNRRILDVHFSPDGKRFAVTLDNNVQIFTAPGQRSADYNPFYLERVLFGCQAETTCLEWTTDSKVLAVGGMDMNTRIYAMERCPNLGVYSLGGHNDAIAACFFAKKSLDCFTVSRNGQLCVWECDALLEKLFEAANTEDDVDEQQAGKPRKSSAGDFDDMAPEESGVQMDTSDDARTKKVNKIAFSRKGRHYYRELTKDQSTVTTACYHKTTRILVVGFSNGSFFLHEMPDFIMIHSLSLGEQSITASVFNSSGDWLALGTSGLGQLVVWEWQSQSFVLKQQGHYDQLMALDYSPDGQYLATGGSDGKVKLWNTSSGFCFVTFTEHSSSVTAVHFTQNGKAVLSASLDGTVRAFDTARYRNFRTFTSPRPAQFSSLAVDSSGEIVCAGSQDSFEVFVWSVQTGRLMEILGGHEAPVSGLYFGNCGENQLLVSSSWDKTVRLWDVFKSKIQQEIVRLNSEALAVAFRPDGNEIATCTLNCMIHFFDPITAQQTGEIETKSDLGNFRRETDLVSGKTASKGRSFTALCYSADGSCILVGGNTKFICIYHAKEHVLLRRFEISKNWSFTGLREFLSKRTDTEFGARGLMDLDEDDAERRAISLPGVKSGDMASRHFKPEVKSYALMFSPTGQSWAACTTEGLVVYSTETDALFDPFDLDPTTTPEAVRRLIREALPDYARALVMSLRLNENLLITEVIEHVPVSEVDLICQTLPEKYVISLLGFCALQLEQSRHLEFYLTWVQALLFAHGSKLKRKSTSIMPLLHTLQRALVRKKEDFLRLAQRNLSTLDYATTLCSLSLKNKSESSGSEETGDVDMPAEEE